MESVLKKIEDLNLKSEYENVQLVVKLDVYKQPTQFVINFPDCEDSINSFKAKAKEVLSVGGKPLISKSYEKYLENFFGFSEYYLDNGKICRYFTMKRYDSFVRSAISILKDKQGKLSKTNQDFHNQIAFLLRNDKSSIDFWKVINRSAKEIAECRLFNFDEKTSRATAMLYDLYYKEAAFIKQYPSFKYFCPVQLCSFVYENKNLFKHLFNNQ